MVQTQLEHIKERALRKDAALLSLPIIKGWEAGNIQELCNNGNILIDKVVLLERESPHSTGGISLFLH